MTPDEQRLLDFFNNMSTQFDSTHVGPVVGHPRGFTPDRICNASDQWLEESHDYIQWAFPLKERSTFNPSAPVLTDTAIALINRNSLHSMFERMMRFYFSNHSLLRPSWFSRDNHNMLRLTRIIKSMNLLGFQTEALLLLGELLQMVHKHPGHVSAETINFWLDAARIRD